MKKNAFKTFISENVSIALTTGKSYRHDSTTFLSNRNDLGFKMRNRMARWQLFVAVEASEAQHHVNKRATTYAIKPMVMFPAASSEFQFFNLPISFPSNPIVTIAARLLLHHCKSPEASQVFRNPIVISSPT